VSYHRIALHRSSSTPEISSVRRACSTISLRTDHNFQIEQWDEALAVFDEWSADVVPAAEPVVVFENAAVRALAKLSDVHSAHDWNRLAALYPDDALNDERDL